MPAPDAPKAKEEKVKLSVYISPKLEWRLRMYALVEKRGPSEIVEELLDMLPEYTVQVKNDRRLAKGDAA